MAEAYKVRYTCTACGNRSRGIAQEFLAREYNRGYRQWLWTHHELCPPCTAALRDFLHPSRSTLDNKLTSWSPSF